MKQPCGRAERGMRGKTRDLRLKEWLTVNLDCELFTNLGDGDHSTRTVKLTLQTVNNLAAGNHL